MPNTTTGGWDFSVDLLGCVAVGHVASPEVHHCNLLAITETRATYMHSKCKWSSQCQIALHCITYYINASGLDVIDPNTYTNSLLSWSREPLSQISWNLILMVGMFLKQGYNIQHSPTWSIWRLRGLKRRFMFIHARFSLKLVPDSLRHNIAAFQCAHIPRPQVVLNESLIKNVLLTLLYNEQDNGSATT